MASHPNEHFHSNLLILKGKNYNSWCKQMKVVFGYQEVCDLVQNGLTPINDRATDEEKVTYKVKKTDYKPLFIFHQCVDAKK